MVRGIVGVLLAVCLLPGERSAAVDTCLKISLSGEVNAGETWKAALGQGWEFRIQPIAPASARYSGWDLVVDRESRAGYPDALLLATPPYGSINQREIGTTFGLRAQDAIGWNPRTFRFLTDPGAFRSSQQLFLSLMEDGQPARAAGGKSVPATEMTRLLELQKHSAAGELHIDNARIVPGVADPAPYAQAWAMAAARTQHQDVPAAAGQATASGQLLWIRFTATLWLPLGWKPPPGLHGVAAACRP